VGSLGHRRFGFPSDDLRQLLKWQTAKPTVKENLQVKAATLKSCKIIGAADGILQY